MDHKERRSIYLDAALRAFLETGGEYNISKTAKIAGKSNSTIRYHFNGKAGLRTRLINHIFDRLKLLIDFYEPVQNRTSAEFLPQVVLNYEYEKAYVIMLNFSSESDEHVKALEHRQQRLRVMKRYIQESNILDNLTTDKLAAIFEFASCYFLQTYPASAHTDLIIYLEGNENEMNSIN